MPKHTAKVLDGSGRRQAQDATASRRAIAASGLLGILIAHRGTPVLGHIARTLLRVIWLMQLPATVEIGEGAVLLHGNNIMIHPMVTIGRHAVICHEVTIGLQEPYQDPRIPVGPIVVGDHALISVGAKVLAPNEGLTVGRGTLVGANSVLLESTGEFEVWGGVPARKLGTRKLPATFATNFPGEGPDETGTTDD